MSLFCGSAVVEAEILANEKILNDKHEYLIEMFKGLQSGYELPNTISKEEYLRIKDNKDKDKVLSGFVGFGCSFGGKWFDGYARNNFGTNYCLRAKTSVMKTVGKLKDAKFVCKDYQDVELPIGCFVYADPPYFGTTKYTNSKNFDYDRFWDYMRGISREHFVFISEEKAPSDFVCIWQKEVKRMLDVDKNNIKTKVEKLFIYKENFKKLKENKAVVKYI